MAERAKATASLRSSATLVVVGSAKAALAKKSTAAELAETMLPRFFECGYGSLLSKIGAETKVWRGTQ